MADRVKPFQVNSPVSPITTDTFRHGKPVVGEKTLFDSVAQERGKIAGTDIEFFSFDTVNSVIDPLYGEPKVRVFKGPYKILGHIEWPDSMPEIREEGLRYSIMVQAWIARKEFEDIRAPYPEEGDVIRVWNTPYINKTAGSKQNIPHAGYYFSIVDIDDDGHLFDNADFVGFQLDMRRNSDFTPERLILPP